MSQRTNILTTYRGQSTPNEGYLGNQVNSDELRTIFLDTLEKGIHGICFSIYEEGQKPGDIISAIQVRRRLEILKPYIGWVRSFSTIEGNELVPKIAKEMGINTLVGAWLGDDRDKNQSELDNLIELCKDGYVDIAAVGNEVLYRNDLPLGELIEKIEYVKSETSNIPVGYVDAYYEFSRHPILVEVCDVILTNYYPFWEGTNIQYSLGHLDHMHRQVKEVANHKKIIITETGWPSEGENTKDAIPSPESAMKYFIDSQRWATNSNIDMFYFSSFDESWKIGAEGQVGAFWGLWDKHEKLKYIK